jgi:hypothetical protein
MATKTEVKLHSDGALSIMEAHDKAGIAYWFNAMGHERRSGTVLAMFVDGDQADMEITLWPNGTWDAKTRIVVGDEVTGE